MEYLKKNIWNFIGAFGTIATLIFGIFGLVVVPNYVKDAYRQRQESANNEIVVDLKEIIFSGLTYDSLIVPTLKKGKEIKYDISMPKSNNEILVEVQESFMSDKFVGLDKRIYLYEKIDSLKRVTPQDTLQIREAKSVKSLFSILTSILSILSLIVSALLLYGLLTKRKEQINEELEKKFEEIQDTRPESINDYINFENLVCKSLKQLKLDFEDYTKNPKSFPFDFLIKQGKKRIGVEVKVRIRQDTLIRIRNYFDKSGLDALIIISNRLNDFSTFSMLSEFRKMADIAGRRIFFVAASDLEKLKLEITEILKTEKE